MSELPAAESDDPSEIDHGELFRKSPRHLQPGALEPRDRKALWTVLAAAAATLTLLALVR